MTAQLASVSNPGGLDGSPKLQKIGLESNQAEAKQLNTTIGLSLKTCYQSEQLIKCEAIS